MFRENGLPFNYIDSFMYSKLTYSSIIAYFCSSKPKLGFIFDKSRYIRITEDEVITT